MFLIWWLFNVDHAFYNGKNVFIQPISQVDLGYPRYKPNFRVCIAALTSIPPKKSSTHFYVNNRDPLCTKKVPLPSQQETAAQPSQPALTYPSWCCLHFYAGELTIFFPRLGKNHYHHIWAILHKKRSDNPSLLLLLVLFPLFLLYYIQMRGEKNYYFCARMVISLGFSWICEHVLLFYV